MSRINLLIIAAMLGIFVAIGVAFWMRAPLPISQEPTVQEAVVEEIKYEEQKAVRDNAGAPKYPEPTNSIPGRVR